MKHKNPQSEKVGLNWTIIRPSGLTDTARTGVYDVGENISAITSQIARADVADLILKELEQNLLIGNAITITNWKVNRHPTNKVHSCKLKIKI